jgi:Effector-associated domain 5/NB-ARC domain
MSGGFLSQEQILAVHRALIDADLAGKWRDLLGSINRGLVATLAAMPDPSSQVLTDLQALNTIELEGGDVPLKDVLGSAVELAAGRASAAVLRQTFAEVWPADVARITAPPPSPAPVRPSFSPVPRQIYAPRPAFTGREAEMKDLEEHPGESEPIGYELTGPGGVGKTELAHVFAQRLAARCPDGQIFVDLQGQSPEPLSAAAVMSRVLAALDPAAKLPEAPDDLVKAYCGALQDKKVLLLFDNASDRAQVEPLVPPRGSMMMLTSRRRFGLTGLYRRDLGALSPAESTALLRRLAHRLDEKAAATIAELCAHLPLGVRLAGDALRDQGDLDPDDYIKALRDYHAGHQGAAGVNLGAVEATLALSFERLTPDARALWPALGVFPEDFDRDAAAAVGALDPKAVRGLLSELYGLSLLEYDEAQKRYGMHDLARVYALHKLSDDAQAAVRRRHAEHFQALAASLAAAAAGPDPAAAQAALARVEAERANLGAGLAWAGARAPSDEAAARLAVTYLTGALALVKDHLPAGEQTAWYEAALAGARKLGDRATEAICLEALGPRSKA